MPGCPIATPAMLNEILEIHKSGQLEEAERRYREYLGFNPDDPEALHLLGVLRRERGDLAEALQLVESAMLRAPERKSYRVSLGGLCLHARLLDDAEVNFAKAIELDPNITSAYNGLAQIATLRGDFAQAEAQFRLALRADPDHAPSLLGLGNLLIGKGEFEAGLRHLTAAVEIDPEDPGVQCSLARAYLMNGNIAFAEQAVGNALALSPGYAMAVRLSAEIAFRAGRLELARERYNQVMDLPGNRAQGLAGLADVLRAEGEIGGAAGLYVQSLELDRRQPLVLQALLHCLGRLQRPDEAIRLLEQHVAALPEDAVARRALASLLAERGQYELAERVFAEVLAQVPDDGMSQTGHAAMLELLGRLDEAAVAAARAVTMRDDAFGAAAVLARSELRNGRPDQVAARLVGYAPEALTPSQRHSRSQLLGLADHFGGRPAGALAHFAEANAAAFAGLPELAAPPADLAEAIAAASPPADAGGKATLLVGAPGTGSALIGALLADHPLIALLTDRVRGQLRPDLFAAPDSLVRYRMLRDDESRIARRRYERVIERAQLAPGRIAIDWLQVFDARCLPQAFASFADLKMIVAERDPRDALLNWLAYGAQGMPAPADPATAASWLARQLAHQRVALSALGDRALSVNADAVLADPASAIARIAAFLGLPTWTPGAHYARAAKVLGGLPGALPTGAHRGYDDLLAGAFAAL